MTFDVNHEESVDEGVANVRCASEVSCNTRSDVWERGLAPASRLGRNCVGCDCEEGSESYRSSDKEEHNSRC